MCFASRLWPDGIDGFCRVPVRKEHLSGALEAHEWVFLPDRGQGGGAVVVAYFSCAMAERAVVLSESALTERCLEMLSESFGLDASTLKSSLLEVKRSCWQADEFSLGSYSYLPPGATQQHRKALAEPHGKRVLFAGEHTRTDYPSTVHGAYLSGQQAAEEAIDQLCHLDVFQKRWFHGSNGYG
eukprot:TRINITY_DN69610_c0_g1_i1.p1 TRINITY_DN69610_c0_g1~~TRINITY_DN69610_c0_g1_i1.p1  ORF type:complete len:200 (-),score=37.09 TRINITY_DN69610_c0_g1_i1:183-734(-)